MKQASGKFRWYQWVPECARMSLLCSLPLELTDFLFYEYRGQVMKDLTGYSNGQYIINLLYWLHECCILGLKYSHLRWGTHGMVWSWVLA